MFSHQFMKKLIKKHSSHI